MRAAFVVLETPLFFGHARLAIIDLKPESNQPMSVNDRHWIVFNGEIFNYVELREELRNLGHSFKTQSDTEVVLRSYEQWGERCVSKFNGMWAFAILDSTDGSMFCSRDRYGEKPFNYYFGDGTFIFASEIKAILALRPELAVANHKAIANFCRASVGAQHEDSWFKNIKRLQPGTNLTFKAGKITLERYWRYPEGGTSQISFDEACTRYEELLFDAVRLRLRSDVPVGLTLSSGLDSTAIARAMKLSDATRFHCYTAEFDGTLFSAHEASPYKQPRKSMSEAPLVQRLADEWGLESHRIAIKYDDYAKSLSDVVWHLESGNSSPAAIPNLEIMRRAKSDVSVVLEGQGADELLGGYINAVALHAFRETLQTDGIRTACREFRELNRVYALGATFKLFARQLSENFPIIDQIYRRSTGSAGALAPLLREEQMLGDSPTLDDEGQSKPLTASLLSQHSGGLVNLLHYGDAMSMAASVEARNPFLDHRLVEFAWQLPSQFKVRGAKGKYIHRAVMQKHLPDYILKQPKLGFATPVTQVFDGSYVSKGGPTPLEILQSKRCQDRGIFDKKGLNKVIADHQSGRHDHGYFLYRLLSTEIWHRTFIDKTAG